MNKKFKWLLREALKNREVRIVLQEVLRACRTQQHSFVPGDPHATAFHCGQQSVGLMLLEWLDEVDPKLPAQLKREHQEFFAVKEERKEEVV